MGQTKKLPTGIRPPTGAQLQFLKSGARFKAFVAGLGGGKTVSLVYDTIRYAKLYPGSIQMLTEPTYPMVRDILLPEFNRQLEYQLEVKPEFKAAELKYTFNFNNSQVWFRQADQFDKLRGPSLSRVGMDEAALCKRQAFDMLASRLRLPGSPLQFMVTTTPRGRNWIYDVFVNPSTRFENAVLFNRSSLDNPYLDEDTKAILRQSYSGTSYRQEVLGQFEVFEGLVYRDFDQDKHVDIIPAADRGWRGFAAGVDWGWTDPTVIVIIGFDAGGHAYVADEWGDTRQPIGTIVEKAIKFRDKYGVKAYFCDPSQPANIFEFQKAGLNAVPANNAILPGIAAVDARIGHNRITFSPSLIGILTEIMQYSFPVDGTGSVKKDMPEDANNHYMDALRYAITGVDGIGLQPEPEQDMYSAEEIIPGFAPVRLGAA